MSEDRVRLRYTGDQATTFPHHGIGEVEHNGTFEVPAGDAERFTRRADVEHDGEAPEAEAQPGSGSSGKPKGGRRRPGPSAQDEQERPATV